MKTIINTYKPNGDKVVPPIESLRLWNWEITLIPATVKGKLTGNICATFHPLKYELTTGKLERMAGYMLGSDATVRYWRKEIAIDKAKKWASSHRNHEHERSIYLWIYRKSGIMSKYIVKKHSIIVRESGLKSGEKWNRLASSLIHPYLKTYAKCPNCGGKGFQEWITQAYKCDSCNTIIEHDADSIRWDKW
tara:strand:- start:17 stop:592 length:576 start_codon:yes stop_codon:yes gene_type:complete